MTSTDVPLFRHRFNASVFEGPPVIIQGPENATVEAGQTVSLICVADGQPTPRISWFFNGDAIPDNFVLDPSNFTLTEVAPVNSGFYHCEAVNEVGQARSASAFLHVYGKLLLSIN